MAEAKKRWLKLDNAAKIYPAAKRRRWSSVFRVSVTLSEEISPLTLKKAIRRAAKRFPSFFVRLRRGMFWYYFEEVPAPAPEKDDAFPCRRMTRAELSRCAIRILYYRDRIAVELFHAVTDGNGAMIFLKSLVAEYLRLQYGAEIPSEAGVLNLNDEPKPEELEDSFLKNEDGCVSAGRGADNAFYLRGTRFRTDFLSLTTGMMPVDIVTEKAKQGNVSVTVYLAACLICAIEHIQKKTIGKRKHYKPVKLLIPVDLRKFYESETLRNFVLYITPGIDPKSGEYTFEETLKAVHHQMGGELTRQNFNAKIRANVRSEKAFILKIMPLFIKNWAMRLVYNLVGEKKSCLTLSNLGPIRIPEEMKKYVRRFDFVLGAQAKNNFNCAVLSYQGKLYCNVTRSVKEPLLERELFPLLVEKGIPVEIESNFYQEDLTD